ncbi:MAG: M23 family metallopeptidase [Desulfobacterales bacterium]|jgi:murein DD-endopeptidase MepM/ murein hydrolase activator NlpD
MNWKDSLNSHLLKTIALKKTRFTEMLIEENGLDRNGFDSWLFCPGMLFSSPEKWWGDHGRRDFPHEGIDLCLYRDHYGRTLRLDEKSRIPVMHDGVVRAIFTDYLGKAVIIEHETPESGNGRFLSVYAHTKPRANVKIGVKVKAGDIIATIADTSRSKANIIPHLHFSLGLPSPSLSFDPFVWNLMRNPDLITLLDPLEVIDWPYQQLDSENPYCFEL